MKFAYALPDGGVAIVAGAPDKDKAHVIARSIPKGVEYVELPEGWQPPERGFRNAWKLEHGKVRVDMARARDLHMGHIREVRNAKLAELDKEWMKHVSHNPHQVSRVEKQRQALRDLPARFKLDGAQTPAELKALWPAELD